LIDLSNRYQSETKQNLFVGSQSSTYIEFKLKRKDSSNIDDRLGSFSTFVNTTTSNVQTLYHQAKEFILHRTVFLLITGICGLYLSKLLKLAYFSSFSFTLGGDICYGGYIFTMLSRINNKFI
jgi:ABC-type xylose transport system permease subunit